MKFGGFIFAFCHWLSNNLPMPFLLSVYMTNLSRLFQLVQQLRMLTDFFDDSFLGTGWRFLGYL